MGLFDKKYCDVCGEKIKLLGNRKLEDGNLCKDCAKKLSPFFDERRHSTVAQIKEQLEYREENKNAVNAFNVTRQIGYVNKVLLDEGAKKFMVSTEKNYREENPDVIDFASVTGCEIDIDESKSEDRHEVRDADGSTHYESYNPPRYDYNFNFYVVIHVNHPYFDTMKLKMNRGSVHIENGGGVVAGVGGLIGGIVAGLTGNAQPVQASGDWRMQNPEYAENYNMCLDVKNTLMQVRQDARDEAANAAAPKKPVICAHCGATTVPTANGTCEFCGAPIG